MALTETRPEEAGTPAPGSERPVAGPVEQLIGSGDHTSIGRLYVGFSLILTAASAITIAVVGVDRTLTSGFLGQRSPMLANSSLVALLLVGALPLLLGLSIAIVPFQVGSPSISFPRAAALSLWTWVVSAGIFIASIAINGGVTGADTDAARLGNLAMGAMMVALGLGSVSVATTVMAHRPPGMGLARVPLFTWSMLVGSALWITTLGSAFAHVIYGQVARPDAAGLARNFSVGLGWLFRGPSIYVVAVPVLGIAADVLTTATGRRISRYGVAQGVIGAYAVLSFGAWSQLPRSADTAVWTLFALAIALPVLAMLGVLGDLMRRGRMAVTPAPVLSVMSVLVLFGAVAAGLLQAFDQAGSGRVFGFNAAALGTAQSYFVIVAAVGGALAGLFHWSPLLWGGSIAKTGGNATVALVVAGGAILATTPLLQGIVQLDGRATGSQAWGAATAVGAVLFGLGVINGLVAVVGAGQNSADDEVVPVPPGLTLEWSFPMPAAGGAVPGDLRTVVTPYPLLDAREASDQEES